MLKCGSIRKTESHCPRGTKCREQQHSGIEVLKMSVLFKYSPGAAGRVYLIGCVPDMLRGPAQHKIRGGETRL